MRPEAIARIHRLELRARAVVEGVLAGLHKSPFKGQSVEFLQHREYVRGDDLRRVDWKVWGRQDRLYVKEYEEETNLRLTLLVDGSTSMDYGGAAASGRTRPTKFECAATLAASLAWLALSHGDAVGCGVFDDRLRSSVPARTKRSHLTSVCEVLEAARNAGAGDFLRVLRSAAEILPKRGMVIVISDLLGDRDGIFKGLQLLRTRGHDLALLHVMDDDEIDFPFEGPTRFEGLELPAHLACNPRALREGYLEAVHAFLADVRRRATAIRCDYALVRTGEPVDAALVRFLSRRASMAV
ncbi:MAG: DUF58 domain-containing protein [Planctomycetia bacterium]|nr:DUF58 domain-containing protein [Planctomycetia bacterium]